MFVCNNLINYSLQTFAIPGPIILSITAGALYGKLLGLIIVSISATSGASCCYLLSNTLAKDYIQCKFINKINYFKSKIQENKHNLFFYLLFLRVTPILPNWFINVSSPIVDIPFKYFVTCTFIGLIPGNMFHVFMGSEIQNLTKIGFDFKVS